MKRSLFLSILFFLLIAAVLPGCYSFKGIAIAPETQTFFVQPFTNQAANVLPTLAADFTETLKDKIRNESRLIFTEIDPHIVFSGFIADYSITAVAPEQGEVTAFNRLEITVSVSYENTQNEEDQWQQRFSFFQDYPSNQNLIDIQDDLIQTINDQLVDDIFNAAFNKW
jgi:hypothetical protein